MATFYCRECKRDRDMAIKSKRRKRPPYICEPCEGRMTERVKKIHGDPHARKLTERRIRDSAKFLTQDD